MAGPKDRRRRAKEPQSTAMGMDAIAAANIAVFTITVAVWIAMLGAGVEQGCALCALPGTCHLYQGLLINVQHCSDLLHPTKALALSVTTIACLERREPEVTIAEIYA